VPQDQRVAFASVCPLAVSGSQNGGTNKTFKEKKMKRIIMLMVLGTMLMSLGGCFWGYEGRDGDGDRDRDRGHDDRGDRHDRGGDHRDGR
jgi:hypothetical protein